MSDLAALAAEIEAELAKPTSAEELGQWFQARSADILAALRASRPEPAADAVEAVARWRGALISLTPGDDRYTDNPEACAAWVKATFTAQDRMLTEVEAREKKLKREVGTLQSQVKSALADSEERLAEFLEARANSANEKGQSGEYMINMDAALAVRSGILGRRAALPRPVVDEGAVERVPTRKQIEVALQDAWNEFCEDAQAHPDCFWREGRELWADFSRGNFVLMVEYNLRAALAAAQEGP